MAFRSIHRLNSSANSHRDRETNTPVTQVYKEGKRLKELIFRHIRGVKDQLRTSQSNSLEQLARAFDEGKSTNLIVLPMGEGKTKLMLESILATKLRTVVCVPSYHLLSQIEQKMLDSGLAGDTVKVFDTKKSSVSEHLQGIFQEEHPPQILLLTYKGLLSLFDRHNDLWERLVDWSEYFVFDEAHNSLGIRSQEILTPLLEKEHLARLFLTATPELANKSVQNVYDLPVLFRTTLEDSFREKTLILPTRCDLGAATYYTVRQSPTYSDGELDDLAGDQKFRLEGGRLVIEESVEQYKQLQKQFGSLPALCICATIAQAEFETQFFVNSGLRAMRVSSGNEFYEKGYTPEEAKNALESGKVDIVVGVGQVTEGWDVPQLRCLISHSPTQSPARYFQRLGRVLRAYQNDNFVKSTHNTFVLEPRWQVLPFTGSGENRENSPTQRTVHGKNRAYNPHNLIEALTLYDYMLSTGQVSEEYLRRHVNIGENTALYLRESYYTHKLAEYILDKRIEPIEWMYMDSAERKSVQVAQMSYVKLARYLQVDGNPLDSHQAHWEIGRKAFDLLYKYRGTRKFKELHSQFQFGEGSVYHLDTLYQVPLLRERIAATNMSKEEFIQYVREVHRTKKDAWPEIAKCKSRSYYIASQYLNSRLPLTDVRWEEDYFHGKTIPELVALFELEEKQERKVIFINVLSRIFPEYTDQVWEFNELLEAQVQEMNRTKKPAFTSRESQGDIDDDFVEVELPPSLRRKSPSQVLESIRKYTYMKGHTFQSFVKQSEHLGELGLWGVNNFLHTNSSDLNIEQLLEALGLHTDFASPIHKSIFFAAHLFEDSEAYRYRAILRHPARFIQRVYHHYHESISGEFLGDLVFFGVPAFFLHALLDLPGDPRTSSEARELLRNKILLGNTLRSEEEVQQGATKILYEVLRHSDIRRILERGHASSYKKKVNTYIHDRLVHEPIQECELIAKTFSSGTTLNDLLVFIFGKNFDRKAILAALDQQISTDPLKSYGPKSSLDLQRQVLGVEETLGQTIVPEDSEDVYSASWESLKNRYPLRTKAYVSLLRATKNRSENLEEVKRYYSTLLSATSSLDDYISRDHVNEQLLKEDQLHVLREVRRMIESGESEGFIRLPTGYGKTVIFLTLIRSLEGKALVVLPTRVLVQQTIDKLRRFAPELSYEVVIGQRTGDVDVYLTTYKSFFDMHKDGILPDDIATLILDEAHESLSPNRMKAVQALNAPLKLGFTATPDYDAEKRLEKLLSYEVVHVTIPEAVESGHLAPFKVFIVDTDVDIREVSLTASGDYNEEELAKALNIHSRNLSAVEFYKHLCEGEKAMAFCASIQHAKDLALLFQEHGVLATWVSGHLMNTDREEYNRRMQAYEEGNVSILCSADLLIRGYDHPGTSVALNLRPSRSPVIVEQRGGRALRLDDEKPRKIAKIVDFFDKASIDSQPLSFAHVVQSASLMPSTGDDASQWKEQENRIEDRARQIELPEGVRVISSSALVMDICSQVFTDAELQIYGTFTLSQLATLIRREKDQVRSELELLDPDITSVHPNTLLPAHLVVEFLATEITNLSLTASTGHFSLHRVLYEITNKFEAVVLPTEEHNTIFGALLALRLRCEKLHMNMRDNTSEFIQQAYTTLEQILAFQSISTNKGGAGQQWEWYNAWLKHAKTTIQTFLSLKDERTENVKKLLREEREVLQETFQGTSIQEGTEKFFSRLEVKYPGTVERTECAWFTLGLLVTHGYVLPETLRRFAKYYKERTDKLPLLGNEAKRFSDSLDAWEELPGDADKAKNFHQLYSAFFEIKMDIQNLAHRYKYQNIRSYPFIMLEIKRIKDFVDTILLLFRMVHYQMLNEGFFVPNIMHEDHGVHMAHRERVLQALSSKPWSNSMELIEEKRRAVNDYSFNNEA